MWSFSFNVQWSFFKEYFDNSNPQSMCWITNSDFFQNKITRIGKNLNCQIVNCIVWIDAHDLYSHTTITLNPMNTNWMLIMLHKPFLFPTSKKRYSWERTTLIRTKFTETHATNIVYNNQLTTRDKFRWQPHLNHISHSRKNAHSKTYRPSRKTG